MYTISNGTERQLMRAGKQFLRNIWSLDCHVVTHTSHRYSIQIWSIIEQLQIIMMCLLVCLASLWKRHYILSLDCQSTLLPHDSRYTRNTPRVEIMLTMVSYRSRDHRRFLSQTSYANISSDILQCSSSLFRSL